MSRTVNAFSVLLVQLIKLYVDRMIYLPQQNFSYECLSHSVVRHPLQNNIWSPNRRRARANEGRKVEKEKRWRTCYGIVPSWNPEVRAIIFVRPSDERKSTPSSWNKVSPIFPRVSRGGKRTKEKERERAHAREDPLSRHAVSGVIDPVLCSPDLCPPYARRVGRTSLFTL